VLFGEVGLTGEVRSVPRAAQRLAEARKLGFSRAILPESSLERLRSEERSGIDLVGVRTLAEALQAVFAQR
jgi:DNA repair protein RadA/Sms